MFPLTKTNVQLPSSLPYLKVPVVPISEITVFMNIDVKPYMCQGVYFNKNNEASICKRRAKYLKHNLFHLCEKHKNQHIHI